MTSPVAEFTTAFWTTLYLPGSRVPPLTSLTRAACISLTSSSVMSALPAILSGTSSMAVLVLAVALVARRYRPRP